MSVKHSMKDIANLLDSDDELPDSYEEKAEDPAYLNDTRFDKIEIPWLNKTKNVIKEKQEQEYSQINLNEEQTNNNNENDRSKILISTGVMTARDLFFIKSIEEYCSESTLIWFIQSLKNNTVPDRFHKSCLPIDFHLTEREINKCDLLNFFNVKYYLNSKHYFSLKSSSIS